MAPLQESLRLQHVGSTGVHLPLAHATRTAMSFEMILMSSDHMLATVQKLTHCERSMTLGKSDLQIILPL
jgi:hypothetical protein